MPKQASYRSRSFVLLQAAVPDVEGGHLHVEYPIRNLNIAIAADSGRPSRRRRRSRRPRRRSKNMRASDSARARTASLRGALQQKRDQLRNQSFFS